MSSARSMNRRPCPKGRWKTWLVLGVVVLLALLLRLYRLDELPPGFHGDEAHNVLDALGVLEGGPRPIFFEANNGREPLFIYLIAAFVALLSESAVAFRATAAIVGTATVGLSFLLVREMLEAGDQGRGRGVRVALLSALLLAISQWHLNFSRMDYRGISLPLLEVASFYFLFRGWHRRSTTSFALAGAGLGLTLYTYTAAVMVPLILALFVPGQWLLRRGGLPRRYWGQLALMLAISLITFAPLGWYYLTHWGSAASHGIDVSIMGGREAIDLGENLGRVAGMFSFSGDENGRHNLAGRPVFDPLLSLAFLAGLGLAGWRLFNGIRRRRLYSDSISPPASPYLFMMLWLGVMLVPSLITTNAPNFLRAIGAVPAVMIFPALALDAAWGRMAARLSPNRGGHWLGASMVATVVSLAALSTYHAYFEDWAAQRQTFYEYHTPSRELATYVKAQGGDYRVYLHKRLARHATTALFLRGTPNVPFDSDAALPFPEGSALYLLPAQGPYADSFAAFLPHSIKAEEIEDSLGEPMALAFRLSSPTQALKGQPGPGMTRLLGEQRPIVGTSPGKLAIAGTLALLGYALNPDANRPQGEAPVLPGQDLEVVLHWQALKPMADDYTISLRLLDEEGRLWAQRDGFPGAGSYPTSLWSQGETVFDRHRLPIPADLPPGSYRLQLAAYILETGAALPLEDGEGRAMGTEAILGPVKVATLSPRAKETFVIQHPLKRAVSPQLTLLGHSLEPQSLAPGESFDLRLFWEVAARPEERLHLHLEASDAQGALVAQERQAILNDQYPAERWHPGDAFQDLHRLRLGPRSAAGPSQIRLQLVKSDDTLLGEFTLEGPKVKELPRLFEKPSPKWELDAQFDEVATLLGFDAEAKTIKTEGPTPWLAAEPGEELRLWLYWQALKETDQSYSVFVHLLDERGQLASQHDGLPAQGQRPTTGWVSGEIIADEVVLTLPSPGGGREYAIIVGLYQPSRAERLLTTTGGDHVVLSRLVVR